MSVVITINQYLGPEGMREIGGLVDDLAQNKIGELQRENQALRSKVEALEFIVKEIPFQEIGEALGLQPGERITPAILPGILRLKGGATS